MSEQEISFGQGSEFRDLKPFPKKFVRDYPTDADPETVSVAVEDVMDQLAAAYPEYYGDDSSALWLRTDMVVREMVTNSLYHGIFGLSKANGGKSLDELARSEYQKDPQKYENKKFTVRLTMNERSFQIEFLDEGNGFSEDIIAKYSTPELNPALTEEGKKQDSGRGFVYADQFGFKKQLKNRTDGKQGAHVILEKDLSVPEPEIS